MSADHRTLDRAAHPPRRDARPVPRVLLLEVEIRTSERTGRPWYSAWLGKARLVGFEDATPNARGHRVIKFYAKSPTPRPTEKDAD